ncbi:MAG: DNA recombination/repair protein RecA, partial [Sphingomonadales bacterium]
MKALKATIERLEKTYGKGVVMKMDDTRSIAVDVVSTGSFSLDLALGVGGFP